MSDKADRAARKVSDKDKLVVTEPARLEITYILWKGGTLKAQYTPAGHDPIMLLDITGAAQFVSAPVFVSVRKPGGILKVWGELAYTETLGLTIQVADLMRKSAQWQGGYEFTYEYMLELTAN